MTAYTMATTSAAAPHVRARDLEAAPNLKGSEGVK